MASFFLFSASVGRVRVLDERVKVHDEDPVFFLCSSGWGAYNSLTVRGQLRTPAHWAARIGDHLSMIKNLAPKLTDAEYEKNFADINPPFAPHNAKIEANRCLYCFDAPCT